MDRDTTDLSRRHFRVNSANAPVIREIRRDAFRFALPLSRPVYLTDDKLPAPF